MNDFRFASPNFLIVLALLPVLYFVVEGLRSAGRERLRNFMAPGNLRRLLVARSALSERGKRWSFWLGLALLALALARPQGNPTIEEVDGMSLDIYVLLDLSRSMDAEDMAPSRLKKAKRTIQHLTDLLSGDRVGVIGFAGTSAQLIPLTSDYGIISTMMQIIDTSAIPSQGTDFEGALEMARQAMERGAQSVSKGEGGPRTNVFIVLSDGEDHAGGKLDIADKIREDGGVVFTIAFGTEKGVPIPVRNERGELLGYKRDRAGNTVTSAVQPKVLQELASRGGGQFYFSTLDEQEVPDILQRVQNNQRATTAMVKARIYEEYFWPLLATALALILFSFVSLRALFLRRAAPAIVLLFFTSAAQAHPLSLFWDKEKRASQTSQELAAQGKPDEAAEHLKNLQAENPDSPGVNFDFGTYLLQAKKHAEGREQLERVAKDRGQLSHESLFNIAGSYALEKKKPEAIANYAELIRRLDRKTDATDHERELLAKAKENLGYLTQANQSNSQSQSGDGQPDQQPQDGEKKQDQEKKSGDNQSDPKDQKDQKDKKDQPDQKDQGKQGNDKKEKDKSGEGEKDKQKDEQGKEQDGDKKDQQKQDQGQNQDQDQKQKPENGKNEKGENKPQGPPRRGGTPYRERDNLSEADAKRILEALKQQESTLQKKFLKKNNKNSKVTDDEPAQDW